MSFSPLFSLKRAAMVEVVTWLIQSAIPEYLDDDYQYFDWADEETDVIKGKIDKLPIPIALKMEMTEVVRPIFGHMWKVTNFFFEQTSDTPIDSIQRCIRMCPWGTVDMKRSAEALLCLSTEELPKLERYRLALLFCLKDHVASTYDDLDEKDKLLVPNRLYFRIGSSTQSLKDPVSSFMKGYNEIRSHLGDFVCAVLDGNEVAARHFWSTAKTLPPTRETVKLHHNFERESSPSTDSGLYLFLLSRYPTDEPLRAALLLREPFLLSLLEWPYLDSLLLLLQQIDESKRFSQLENLIMVMFHKSNNNRFEFSCSYMIYEDILRKLLKVFLMANADRRTDWLQVAFDIIREILFYYPYDDCFVLVVLEFLEEDDKVRLCKTVSDDIVWFIRGGHLHRLDWLFSVCLTNEQSKALKEDIFGMKNLRRIFSYPKYYERNGKEAKELVAFCCTSQNKFEEMTMEIERYVDFLQSE